MKVTRTCFVPTTKFRDVVFKVSDMVAEHHLHDFVKFFVAGKKLLTIETRFSNALLLPIRCEYDRKTVQEF
jgi:hypothetical protein